MVASNSALTSLTYIGGAPLPSDSAYSQRVLGSSSHRHHGRLVHRHGAELAIPAGTLCGEIPSETGAGCGDLLVAILVAIRLIFSQE
jgi:hypothetical protein